MLCSRVATFRETRARPEILVLEPDAPFILLSSRASCAVHPDLDTIPL